MVANIKHINDYKFVDQYLRVDRVGEELHASTFLMIKGLLLIEGIYYSKKFT